MAELPAKQAQYVQYAEKDSKGRNIAGSIDEINNYLYEPDEKLDATLNLYLNFGDEDEVHEYSMAMTGILINKDSFVQYINTNFGTTFETMEDVKNGWDTLATAVVGGYGITQLLLTYFMSWIGGIRTIYSKVMVTGDSGMIDIASNSVTTYVDNTTTYIELYVGGLNLTALNNNHSLSDIVFHSASLTYTEL